MSQTKDVFWIKEVYAVESQCNRVGITAYPVFGTIKSDGTLIPHGWVAMRVDDSTYYIDPTYVCQTGEMDNLKMKNEMERIGDRQYQLEDSFEY